MPDTTTSAVLVEPRHIELWEFDLPEIGPNAALMKVEGTGICGSDWSPYAGTRGQPLPPTILGHEVIGSIVELGSGAGDRWGVAEGDRIVVEESIPCNHCQLCRTGRYHMCDPVHTAEGMRYGLTPVSVEPSIWGGFGRFMYIHPNSVVHKVSAGVPVEQAPLFIPLSNGIRWVERDGGCRIGDTVVIMGPGQHGLGCVIGAGLAGAGEIIVVGTGKDSHRLAVAKQLGADHVVSVDDGPVAEQVREITNGQMGDVVLDVTSAAPGALADATLMARVGATIVLAGAKEGKPVTNLVSDVLLINELTIKGVYGHDWTSVDRALGLIESKSLPLDVMCTHTFPLEQADHALRTLGGEGEPDAIHITIVPGD
jgi:threonine dehydrogenase-like Zn-dependent dehydrogenase